MAWLFQLSATENDTIFQMSLNVWANRPVSNYSIRLGGTDAVTEDVWLHDRTGALMTLVLPSVVPITAVVTNTASISLVTLLTMVYGNIWVLPE